MYLEQLRRFFIRKEIIVPPEPQNTEKCVGFLDQTQGFQFTTFETDPDKERIMRDLKSAGFSVVGIIDGNRARKLAMIDPPSDHPGTLRF